VELTRHDAGACAACTDRPGACLRPGGLELTDSVVDLARLPQGARVLDVGCGSGATVAHLAGARGLRVTGLDASAAQIVRARAAWPGLDVVEGRAEELPFAAGSFDAVLAECVLSTLPEPGFALREMRRVLSARGCVILTDVYDREGDGAPPRPGLPSLGRREAVEALLAGAGLEAESWEDHTGVLARLFWDMAGSAAAPNGAAPRGRAVAPPPPGARPGRRLGYFACVARARVRDERATGRDDSNTGRDDRDTDCDARDTGRDDRNTRNDDRERERSAP